MLRHTLETLGRLAPVLRSFSRDGDDAVQSSRNIESRLAAEIEQQARTGSRPFLVAIDGKSGVGKTTVTSAVAARLDATLIAGDDFFAGGVAVRTDEPAVLAADCIDRARLRSVLDDMKAGREARFNAFDWQAFDGSVSASTTVLEPRPIVILEGVYANHPDFRPVIDYSILLLVDAAERQRRLVSREGELTEWERQWHAAEEWYFDNLAPHDAFDYRIHAD